MGNELNYQEQTEDDEADYPETLNDAEGAGVEKIGMVVSSVPTVSVPDDGR